MSILSRTSPKYQYKYADMQEYSNGVKEGLNNSLLFEHATDNPQNVFVIFYDKFIVLEIDRRGSKIKLDISDENIRYLKKYKIL